MCTGKCKNHFNRASTLYYSVSHTQIYSVMMEGDKGLDRTLDFVQKTCWSTCKNLLVFVTALAVILLLQICTVYYTVY